MIILMDSYRNKKHIALVKINSKFEIRVEGVKYGHAFRNLLNAKQTYLTILYGHVGKDI